ncbi:MAG: hypothetical protein HRU29_11495 [Rhizobiales bacterium]|nr:hypothetical protein [Hyphomicrobiales bacterium]NRB15013.1 hypothetical protein [Hyphomicrobiales bacterium]
MKEFEIKGINTEWFRDGDLGVNVTSWMPGKEEVPGYYSSGPEVHMLKQIHAMGNTYEFGIVCEKGTNLCISVVRDGKHWGYKLNVHDSEELIDESYWTSGTNDPYKSWHSKIFAYSSDDRTLLVDNMKGLAEYVNNWQQSFQIVVTLNPITQYTQNGQSFGPRLPDDPTAEAQYVSPLRAMVSSDSDTNWTTIEANAGGVRHGQQLTHVELGSGDFTVDESTSKRKSISFNIFVLPDRQTIEAHLSALTQDAGVFE